jgi:hypothetical protein
MLKQEAMKPGEKALFMALSFLNHSLHFSGFHRFLLKLWYPVDETVSLVNSSEVNLSAPDLSRANNSVRV